MSQPPPDSVLIRDGTDCDGPALAEIIAWVFAEYEGCPFVPEEFAELGAVASHVGGRGGRIWVAEQSGVGGGVVGRMVGCLAMAPTHEPGTAELFKVYLARPARGRGIAARLLGLAVEAAQAMGVRRLVAWSGTRFADGHRFYERHGFVRRPGLRALHDAGRSLEIGFVRDLDRKDLDGKALDPRT